MDMPQRRFGNDNRYGFNGKERDKDMHSLTAYDYGFRIYNPAIGKFLSVDPLTGSYPMLTPYQFASNSPINSVDLDGLESKVIIYNTAFLDNIADISQINATQIIQRQKAVDYLILHLMIPNPGPNIGPVLSYQGGDYTGSLDENARQEIICSTVSSFLFEGRTDIQGPQVLLNPTQGPGTCTRYYDFYYAGIINSDSEKSYDDQLKELTQTISVASATFEMSSDIWEDEPFFSDKNVRTQKIKGAFELYDISTAISTGDYSDYLKKKTADITKTVVEKLVEKTVEGSWASKALGVGGKFAGKSAGFLLSFLLSSDGESDGAMPLTPYQKIDIGKSQLRQQVVAAMLFFFLKDNTPDVITIPNPNTPVIDNIDKVNQTKPIKDKP